MRSLPLLLAPLALALGSCSSPVAPEGFMLNVRLMHIDPEIVDEMRLRFDPPDGMAFEDQPEMSYEEGAITVGIDSDGSLLMTITGAHVRANAVDSEDETQSIYPLQIWSDDPAMNAAPLVIGSVTRSGEFIGDGLVYLPAWPPPTEASTQLPITCTATPPERCRAL